MWSGVMGPPGAPFVPHPSSRQNDSTKDIRCAEIKAIPTMKSSDQPPKTFKIGEYNRATASFEIPSATCTPIQELDRSMPGHEEQFSCNQLFQSSFARSMASVQSKSMDYSVNSGCDTHKSLSIFTGKVADSRQAWQIPGKEVCSMLYYLFTHSMYLI